MNDDRLFPPIMLAKLSSTPDCCLTVLTRLCAPPGLSASPLNAASSAGTTALTPDCASLRLSPSAPAIRPIMSGVKNCIMYETRLVAMGNLRFLESKSGSPRMKRAFAVRVPAGGGGPRVRGSSSICRTALETIPGALVNTCWWSKWHFMTCDSRYVAFAVQRADFWGENEMNYLSDKRLCELLKLGSPGPARRRRRYAIQCDRTRSNWC